MNEPKKLFILWTNAEFETSDKMVMMYATNCMLKAWWEEVVVIIWGATARLAAMNETIQLKINIAQSAGVKFTACKACADQLGVAAILAATGVEVAYLGETLTDIIKSGEKLITV